jgi:hypothetical protein
MWQLKDVKIQNIFLDTQNIRIPITLSSQNALIQDLFVNEDAFEIVKSIAQYGLFPDEFPIIIEENNRKIVIEGNRRIAALKAMNEPDIVPAYKARLISYQKNSVNTIRVVVAPDRESATTLIANKHTINLRKPWKPLRQAYFYKSQIENGKSIDQLIKEYPEHDIIKFIKMLEMHKLAKSINYSSDEIAIIVHDERKFAITNLDRMYSDPSVRAFLGISFNEKGQVIGNIDFGEFEKGYRRIVEDVATGEIDSRKYNSDTQRKAYLEKIPYEQTPDKNKVGNFTSSTKKEIVLPKIQTNTRNTSTKIPKGLFSPSTTPFKIHNASLRIMYDELRTISVELFPNATHDLLRSFLECSLVYFLKERDLYKHVQKNENHFPKLSEMLTYIGSPKNGVITDSNLIQLIEQIKSQYSESYSLERMNMRNHNENWVSTEKDVRAAWAKLENLFSLLLGNR